MSNSRQAMSFDPVWEELYLHGHSQRAPWDIVVSFLFRYAPKDRPRDGINILEVGCGTASNLWFAAREGFVVAGIDASSAAIVKARQRFAEDGLAGRLEVGDFTALPFDDTAFDLVVDRAALTCSGTSSQRKAIAEIHRVLKRGGCFLYTPYADTHASCAAGKPGPDGVTTDIAGGTLQGVGQIRFVAQSEIGVFLPDSDWQAEVVEYQSFDDKVNPTRGLHSSWRIIARKR
jgi:SAM-dependent methyltransferase